jgi:hypothetical protein
MKLDPELKEAICQMPEKEKDKLLLRLIAKDELLAAKLRHELLENDQSEAKKQELTASISQLAAQTGWTPGLIMMDMRQAAGAITRYEKITRDKQGGIDLWLHTLDAFFSHQAEALRRRERDAGTFSEYVIGKVHTLLDRIEKLHPDLWLDHQEPVNRVIAHLYAYPPTERLARRDGIPESWPEE